MFKTKDNQQRRYKRTWRYIREDGNIRNYRRENLISYRTGDVPVEIRTAHPLNINQTHYVVGIQSFTKYSFVSANFRCFLCWQYLSVRS
jgi:hypothetical protein